MSSTKTTKQILVEGRALITPREQWTQHVFARDDAGGDVDPCNPAAFCFCSIGAIANVTGLPDSDAGHCPAAQSLKDAMEGDIAEFNDAGTHEEVLAAWDRAIAAEAA